MQVVEERLEARLDLLGLHALQLEDRLDVLRDGELAEDRRFLRQVRQAQARAPEDRQVREVLAVERHRAAVDGHQPEDHVEARGLARAVGAEEPHHLAAFHGERHVGDHRALAIALHQPFGAQHRGARLGLHQREALRGRGRRGGHRYCVPASGLSVTPGSFGASAPAGLFLGGRMITFTRPVFGAGCVPGAAPVTSASSLFMS